MPIKLKVYPPFRECVMCKKTLLIDNFEMAIRKTGERRAKCRPCNIEHKHRINGTWESYCKEQAYRKELHQLQKDGKRRCRMCDEVKELNLFQNDVRPQTFYDRKTYCKTCSWDTWRVPYIKKPEYKAQKRKHDITYSAKHRVKLNKKQVHRYHSDPEYKIKVLLRSVIGKVLRSKGATKCARSQELLGCTIAEYKQHLESQFHEGMTWDNHSMHGWHVDHIIPLDYFNLKDPEQQKKAFHYTNLQPLWAKDNIAKSNKLLT